MMLVLAKAEKNPPLSNGVSPRDVLGMLILNFRGGIGTYLLLFYLVLLLQIHLLEQFHQHSEVDPSGGKGQFA